LKIDVSNHFNKHEVNNIVGYLELAYRFIWIKVTLIQYILLDFEKITVETIDCRTKDGQIRYIELYGIKKFRAKAKVYSTEILSDQFHCEMILSNNLIKFLFRNLNERSRRLVTGFLVLSITTRNRVKLTKFISLDSKTVAKGIKELISGNVLKKGNIRRQGGGRKSLEQLYTNLNELLEELVSDHVAGDPMTERRWIRKSLSFFEKELRLRGIKICAISVRTYFKKIKISLKGNLKNLNTQHHSDRDLQFHQINRIRKAF
jgi:hypothetical protein